MGDIQDMNLRVWLLCSEFWSIDVGPLSLGWFLVSRPGVAVLLQVGLD